MGFWQFALAGFLVFLADAFLAIKDRKQIFFAILHLALFILSLTSRKHVPSFYAPDPALIIPVVIVALFLVISLFYHPWPVAKDDTRYLRLKLTRVKATLILAIFLALTVTFWHGNAGFRWIMPPWCALSGSAIYRASTLAGSALKQRRSM